MKMRERNAAFWGGGGGGGGGGGRGGVEISRACVFATLSVADRTARTRERRPAKAGGEPSLKLRSQNVVGCSAERRVAVEEEWIMLLFVGVFEERGLLRPER
ncbi:predicted protein [Coccidioides posadasii str. Silveira]|uniref:Predicted protein n=1 Tax=Coccidioides posadasii (strain RMSCC 757 / Silveira) TaxID=443226 RepID=E9DDI5_COCPS|nr:predicted protein [Coccidioides posadasii str. Silveira]